MKHLFIMDPIQSINIKKDSTFAVMLAAQKAGHDIYYTEGANLFLRDGNVYASIAPICVMDDANNKKWFEFLEPPQEQALEIMDIIWMRLDPPFNMTYIYMTYLLDIVEKKGVRIVNRPSSIRDCNEKLFAQWFPACCPPTLVTNNVARIKNFLLEQSRIIVKPLDGMGGRGIFYCESDDKNKNVILETATHNGSELIMAQRFLPEITAGDKRITMIDGEPLKYAVARIPANDEFRGNLAAGGHAKVIPLTTRDRWLCSQVAPTLKEKGLFWVGLDVIGDYITEINVTSPTCLREVEEHTKTPIAELLIERLI
ncbi:MAG: glutathione synthase [Pseudomonadota bacterium]